MAVFAPPALVAVQVSTVSLVSAVMPWSWQPVLASELGDCASVTLQSTATSPRNQPVPSTAGLITREITGAESSTRENPLRARTCTPAPSTYEHWA